MLEIQYTGHSFDIETLVIPFSESNTSSYINKVRLK